MERNAFQKSIDEDLFLEWAEVHGEFYGTPSDAVDDHLDKGENVIMDLDVQGAIQVKRQRPETQLIFIMPPSLEVLRKRIETRRTESEAAIQRRLSIAEKEMDHRDQFDFVIVNDVLDKALRELKSILQGGVNPDEEIAT